MNILIDTCTFLWIITNDPALSADAKQIFLDIENSVFLSTVSTWEIAVKHSLGKLPLPQAPDAYIPRQRKNHGIDILPLSEEATLQLPRLPALHRDPFDRMMICQCIAHSMAILTPDEQIRQYPVRSLW
jgi:PIN domain nuclease of toxin-antitoxin system